ncbi:hypothetical protein IQ07DRAFT_203076 [Pyrenochaeta sp. DS3sAY3a]|nr:hypothetical protein IQ07DRAFT_203076 [Pyrenochaeta sp. DS3sAY3a]
MRSVEGEPAAFGVIIDFRSQGPVQSRLAPVIPVPALACSVYCGARPPWTQQRLAGQWALQNPGRAVVLALGGVLRGCSAGQSGFGTVYIWKLRAVELRTPESLEPRDPQLSQLQPVAEAHGQCGCPAQKPSQCDMRYKCATVFSWSARSKVSPRSRVQKEWSAICCRPQPESRPVSLGIPPVNDSQPGEHRERTSMRTRDSPALFVSAVAPSAIQAARFCFEHELCH